MLDKNWNSPYDYFYRVSDQDGKVYFESVNKIEAEEFLQKKYAESGNLFNMEQVAR